MRLCHLLAATSMLSASLAARAVPITYDISFTASGRIVQASGSYTITLDPTLEYPDTTTGLTVDSFSDTFPVDSAVGFKYIPAGNGYLSIGGTYGGVSVTYADDYDLVIYDFATDPTFHIFTADSSTESDYATTGTVTVTQLVAATPEPSSFALLGTGLLGAAGVVRRRFAT